MAKLCFSLALMVGLAWGLGLRADGDKTPAPPAADQARIEELIKQLGSAKYAQRDQARKELEGLGVSALDALRRAMKDTDLETSRRAAEIVRKLEDKLLTEQMLAPKRLRLKLKDAPVLDAVAELSRLSGYNIQVMGDRTGLADKKITLDTGETTFFEALDALCREAGLVDSQPVNQGNPGQPGVRFRKAFKPGAPPLPPQILPVPVPPAPPPPPMFRLGQAGGGNVAAQAFAQAAPQRGVIEVVPQPAIRPEAAQAAQAPAVKGVDPKVLQQAIDAVQGRRPGQVPGGAGQGASPSGQIHLTPGKAQAPTSFAGAVRVRLLPRAGAPAGEASFILDLAAEPRLQGFQIVSTARIDKVIDDQGQKLAAVPDLNPPQPNVINPNGMAGRVIIMNGGNAQTPQRQATVTLKRGEKAAKTLKELSGTITAQALMPTEALASVDNILKAAGQTAKVKEGGSMQVKAVEKLANGDYQVKVTMEDLPGFKQPGGFGGVMIQGGGQIIIQGNGVVIQRMQIGGGGVMIGGNGGAGNHSHLPKLLDAKGQAYQLVSVPEHSFQINNAETSVIATLVFRPQAGQGEPAQLVYYGQRTVNFQVPFTFRDVTLP